MSSQQQMILGTSVSFGIESAEEIRDALRATYSGYTINSEVSDKGIYMTGSGTNTRTVTINTGDIGASSFRIWCIGAGGSTISVWTPGFGGGGTYADHDNTGGNMVCKMGGEQGGWNAYTAGYNGGDSEVAYDGYTMVGEASSGAGSGTQGSYTNNFPGTKAGGSGGTGAGSSGRGGHSQYGGGGGAGMNGTQGYAGNAYNYGGAGAADSGRSSNSMNGAGGSSYGYGCYGCCEGAAYYGCSPGAGYDGGGGCGADSAAFNTNGNGMIVIQWGSGIKSVLSSYSSGAQNF